ncbi:MAG: PQQ-binding-like beta-propeller repeat protein [Planctomycetota bacterium]
MQHPPAFFLFLILATALPLAAEDWPAYGGGDGACAAGPVAAPLVDAWIDAELAWRSDARIPDGLAGDARKPESDGHGLISGGYATPIVAAGRVYLQYYLPAGVPDRALVREHGERFTDKFRVAAHDVIHCFDAATGTTLWRSVLGRQSLNMQAFTKGGPSLTCCYGDGRIYAHVNGARVHALDAATGAPLWSYATARHARMARYRELAHERQALVGFNRDYATSPVCVDGVVVFNDHLHCKLTPPGDDETRYYYDEPSTCVALDAATGAELWRLPDGLSNVAQPLVWRQDDTALLLAPGSDAIRCIEPRSGTVRWQIPGDGGRIVVGAGHLITGNGAKNKRDRALVAYRITATEAQRAWELAGHGRPAHFAARDGLVYCDDRRGSLLCIDAARGTVVARAPATNEPHFGTYPVIVGSRIVCAGSDSNQLHLYGLGPTDLRLLDHVRSPHAWGYTMPLIPACADGRVYLRTHDRLACYDLRARDDIGRATITFTVPAPALDAGEPFTCTIRLRDGHPRGGTCRRGDTALHVGTDALQWDGEALRGAIELENPFRGTETFTLAATRTDDAITGTITPAPTAFAEPLPLAGAVTLVERQAWMPPCTHVLHLAAATRTRSGEKSHLYLFLTVADGRLSGLRAMADRTIKSWPALINQLTLSDGQLSGSVLVRYRPDRWSTVLVEQGASAAARYTLQVALDGAEEAAGTYSGHWGVAWPRVFDLAGNYEPEG